MKSTGFVRSIRETPACFTLLVREVYAGIARREQVDSFVANPIAKRRAECITGGVKKMKILFIGGTGNISTDCVAVLHERGHPIGVVTRGNAAASRGYRTFKADRRNLDALRGVLTGETFDVVINFLGYDVPDLAVDYALFAGRIRQYIFISSATVYAKPHRQLPITEKAPLGNVFSDYAQKKLRCEEWLRERAGKLPVTIVRPSHTYSKTWIPNQIASAGYSFAARLERGESVYVLNDGENPWALTAAQDFAVGLAGLVGNEKAIGECFHITTDEALTWNQIYAEIGAALGVNPVIEKIPADFICEKFPDLTGSLKGDKVEPGVFDNSKIKRFVPGFICQKPFAAGIREAVAWLRAHPDDQNLSPKLDATADKVIRSWRDNRGR
jgi:nucleoside-diphosphate-sugar epimerase